MEAHLKEREKEKEKKKKDDPVKRKVQNTCSMARLFSCSSWVGFASWHINFYFGWKINMYVYKNKKETRLFDICVRL